MIYVSNMRTYNLQEENSCHKGHVSILHGHPWYLILPSPLQLPNLSPYFRLINAKMWKYKKYENEVKFLTLRVYGNPLKKSTSQCFIVSWPEICIEYM